MIFNSVLSGANSIMAGIRSYPKRVKAQRLYKQWAEKAGLQPDVIHAEDATTENTPRQAVTASSVSVKPKESQQSFTQDSQYDDISHESLIPEDIRARVRSNREACIDPSSREETRKVAVFMMAEINKEQLRLPILLMLLGASLVIFCLGVILLIVYSFAQ